MIKTDQYTPVRFSHLTGYAGVGSIVRDNNDFLMVVADTRYWTNKNGDQIAEPINYVERIKKHLKITKNLKMPPTAQVGKNRILGYPLPAVIFPSYSMCRYCNRIHHKPWSGIENNISKDLLCGNGDCKKAGLEQVTWCAISSKGDLTDVDWHYLCHKNAQNQCARDNGAAYLEIISGPKGKKHVRCTRCESSEIFEQSDTKYQGGLQPWLKWIKNDAEPTLYTTMEINDPRVYSAKKSRAIVIPPESNVDKNSIVYKLICDSVFLRNIHREHRGLKRKKLLISAANDYRCSVDEIKNALVEIEDVKSELDNITTGEMYSDEYKALMAEEDFKDGVDFVTRHKTTKWHDYLEEITLEGDLKKVTNFVGEIVTVNRLRVIEVFKGFTRKASDSNPEEEEIIVPPDITNELDWLPAIELFGEGIFFTINQKKLNEWENLHEVRLRADEVSKRYSNSNVRQFDNLSVISPRFILLHTLSHLIIRELEISAGYPAASLKERIYSSQVEGMAGILIYTAVADIAGSLGGIVEAAEPQKFLKLLDGAFKHAQWCSLDPVCTEHEGQGPSWLNRAACHACSLIPETSCEYGNLFLDRVFIKGNEKINIPPILDVIGIK